MKNFLKKSSRNFFAKFLPSLMLGVTILAGAPAHAELALSLSSASNTYLLGEPLSVSATLTNVGSQTVNVYRDLAPEFEAVKYFIKRPDGQESRFTPWAIKEPGDPFVALAPGKSITDAAPLFFDGSHWIFTEPGDYEIRGVYFGATKSEPLKITISAPSGAKEREASRELLASPEAGLFLLLGGGDHLADGLKVLQRISESAQGTPYATHADIALGLNFVRPFADFKTQTVRPADPLQATQHLERVDVSRLSLATAATAKLALAQAYRAQNELEKASRVERDLPAQLEKQFPQLAPSIREQILPRIQQNLK